MPSLLTSNSYTANSGDNTSFRAYGTAISDAFANAGWTKASDTGNTDWTSVVANGTSNTTQDNAWEIWRMSDALQSTAPCYVKITYKTWGGTNAPGFTFQLGTGTNGTGGLTGVLSANTAVQISTQASTITGPFYFCGDTSRMMMALWSKATTWTSGHILLGIERTKDANGNDTAEGILFLTAGLNVSFSAKLDNTLWIPYAGACTPETDLPIFTQNNATGGSGTAVNLYPIYINKGVFVNPLLNAICAPSVLCTYNVPFSVTFYGATHTFLPLPSQAWDTRTGAVTSATFPLCMRWE